MTLRITSIGRSDGSTENLLVSITHFHWIEDGTELAGMFTREEMFDFVRRGGEVYVLDEHWRKHLLHTAVTHQGVRYLCTKAQGLEDERLLSLPLCPQE